MAWVATPPTPTPDSVVKWEELARLDDARRAVEATLKGMLEQAERTEQDLRVEIQRLKAHEKELLVRVNDLDVRGRVLQENADTAPFVILLVDGDVTQFADSFVKTGFDGAHNASHLLRRELETYLRSFLDDFKPHWKIMVRVYANLHGLAETYHRARVVSEPYVTQKFFSGFNRELPFFEFIDASNDKEGADSKIKDYLGHYLETANCKHVLLAGSGDRSYVGFLRKFSAEASQISLVEALPFEGDFRSLATRFPITRLGGIFKDTKLVAPPTGPSSLSRPSSYATVINAAGLSTTSASPVADAVQTNGQSTVSRGRIIRCNKLGERVDDPLPHANKDIVFILQKIGPIDQRPCARNYLTECKFKDSCKYGHTAQYNEEEKTAIRRLARYNPCGKKKNCRDGDCVASHACPHVGCSGSCRFSNEMHGVDKVVTDYYPV